MSSSTVIWSTGGSFPEPNQYRIPFVERGSNKSNISPPPALVEQRRIVAQLNDSVFRQSTFRSLRACLQNGLCLELEIGINFVSGENTCSVSLRAAAIE